jgi:hypothetical protein
MNKLPNPGSDEAIKKGCTCAIMDNAYGRGAWGTQDKAEEEKLFWINGGCPLHGKERISDSRED